MKALIYSKTFLPDLGGLERNTLQLASALASQNIIVTIITETNEHDISIEKEFNIIRTKKSLIIFREIAFNNLIIVNGGLSLKINVIAWLCKKKSWVIYHNAFMYKRLTGRCISITNFIRRIVSNFVTHNIAVSKFALQNVYVKNGEVLVNPAEMSIVQYANQPISKKYDLLFVGRIIEGKGIFILAEALKHMPHLTLQIVGKGEHWEQLENELKKNKINYYYKGVLKGKDLAEAYQNSKVTIVPSSSHIEGNPLVIAESISLGTPVIASNQPAMVEAIGQAGTSFDSGNSGSLFAILKNVFIDDRFLLRNISEQCESEAKKFSIDTYNNTIIRLLKL
jgi:glycosyltransferase involved in cell wall biosynthesis